MKWVLLNAMTDDPIILILSLNLATLFVVAVVAFAWIKLKARAERKKAEREEETGANNSSLHSNEQNAVDTKKLEDEITLLKKQLSTQKSRIKNLEKFKELYFKIDELVQTETERLRQSLLTIIDISRQKEDRADLLLEAENIFHSLKKIHPLLESIRPELFEDEDLPETTSKIPKAKFDETIAKQLELINTLQQELSKSKEAVAKLEYLERLAKSSAEQNSKMKIELAKARSLAKNSRQNQIKAKTLQTQLDALMKKERRDSDEKVSLNRKIAHMTDEVVAPADPKDLEMSSYIDSLVSSVAEKQDELTKSQYQYKQMEEEYNRLFYQLQDSQKSKTDSPEAMKLLRKQLREAEVKMNETGIEVKLAEGEVISLSNNCDELIAVQQKYDTLKEEYKMLSEGINNQAFSDEHKLLQAKVKSLTLENTQLKEVDSKLSEAMYELERARVEYTMLEHEYIKLVDDN